MTRIQKVSHPAWKPTARPEGLAHVEVRPARLREAARHLGEAEDVVITPSPASTKTSGLQAPVRTARAEGMLKIALPMTPLTTAAVRSQRPMARTRPGGSFAPGSALAPAMGRDHTPARGAGERADDIVRAGRATMSYRIRLAAGLVAAAAAATLVGAPTLRTENVVLITTDGLRWQEVFGGADEQLLTKEAGVSEPADLEREFWRDTPAARREALLPFLWTVIARQGQIYGNAPRGSIAKVTNGHNFSYPGYNEILSGIPDPRVDSNDKKLNPNVTVLEWLNGKGPYRGKVAAFCSWDVFPWIINRERSGVLVNAGFEPVTSGGRAERLGMLNELLAETTPAADGVRHDSFTFAAALEHVRAARPRVLYLSLGETDDWAHAGRYDHYLHSARRFDRFTRQLWDEMQGMDQYRGKTTFVITTDHGRGGGLTEWKSHGEKIPASENIWIAVMGPDTPALGERAETEAVTQSQVAATVAAALGEDFAGARGGRGSPDRRRPRGSPHGRHPTCGITIAGPAALERDLGRRPPYPRPRAPPAAPGRDTGERSPPRGRAAGVGRPRGRHAREGDATRSKRASACPPTSSSRKGGPDVPGRRSSAITSTAASSTVGKDGPAGLGSTPDQHYAIELARRGYVTIAPDALCFGERQDPAGKLKDAAYERFEALHRLTEGKTPPGQIRLGRAPRARLPRDAPGGGPLAAGHDRPLAGRPGDAVHHGHRHAHQGGGVELRFRQPAHAQARPDPAQLRAVRARAGRARRLRGGAGADGAARLPGGGPHRRSDLSRGRHRGDGGGRAGGPIAAAGAADRLGTFYEPGPHQFSPALREAAYAWLDRWLEAPPTPK